MMISGHFSLETSAQKISMRKGEMLLISKNQLGQITKTPQPDDHYETIVISLQEDLLRNIALDEHIETQPKYTGPPNILIPPNEFLKGYFQSVLPYVRNPEESLTNEIGMLKVKEAVKLKCESIEGVKLEYFELASVENLKALESVTDKAILLIAAYVGDVRLIDNLLLNED